MSKALDLAAAYHGSRLIESAESYARADAPLAGGTIHESGSSELVHPRDYDLPDGQFWWDVLKDPESSWGKLFFFPWAALSEWVPRVPGLYWKPGSEALRKHHPEAVEYRTERYTVYIPGHKSVVTTGGVGTLRFPQDEHGNRLVTLTCNLNASGGIPLLIPPEVWDHHKPREGSVYSGRFRWERMTLAWASRFPSQRGIPKGCLRVQRPEDLTPDNQVAQVEIHPCTIMQYYQAAAEWFDFVYTKEFTGEKNYRKGVEDFFEEYRTANGRQGRYLLAGDVADPLWDADYQSPEQLRGQDPGAAPQLDLLTERVRQRYLGNNAIEALSQELAAHCTEEDLRSLSDEVGIPVATWYAGGKFARVVNQFLDAVVRGQRLDVTLEAYALRYPDRVQPRK